MHKEAPCQADSVPRKLCSTPYKSCLKVLPYHLEVNHEENPKFDPKGNYPLIAYQAFYRLDVTKCHPFLREYESQTRIWVEPSEIKYVMNDHELINDIIEDALTLNA